MFAGRIRKGDNWRREGEAATAGIQMWGEKDRDDGGMMKGPVWGGF